MSITEHDSDSDTIYWRPMNNPDQNPELHLTNGLLPQNPRVRGSQNWWTDHLSDIIEACIPKTSVDNGRRYMRKGQIIEMQLRAGALRAWVQGSADKPYEVQIDLPTLVDEQWEQLVHGLLERLDSVAELMADIMPRDIESFIGDGGVRLFPKNLDAWSFRCTCQEESCPCTHAMAVIMLFLDRFDSSPFLLFFLRGRGGRDIVGRLREHWGLAGGEEGAYDDGEKLVSDYDLATFFHMRGRLPDVEGTPPPPEGIKVIRRLGFPPFFPAGDRTVQQTLENLYEE